MIKKLIKDVLHAAGIDIKKYTPPNYGWIRERNISAVLDIGANTGQFAEIFHKILPGAQIYSFEPVKKCYEELLKRSSALNVTAFNYALGEADGETEIFVSEHSPSSSILPMTNLHKELYSHTSRSTKETITIKTLDGIAPGLNLAGRPYLVKIDVQGFEDRVIKGGINTIRNAEILLVEMSYEILYDRQLLFDDLYRIIVPLGFEFAGNMVQTFNSGNGHIVYSDSIFLKRKRVS